MPGLGGPEARGILSFAPPHPPPPMRSLRTCRIVGGFERQSMENEVEERLRPPNPSPRIGADGIPSLVFIRDEIARGCAIRTVTKAAVAASLHPLICSPPRMRADRKGRLASEGAE